MCTYRYPFRFRRAHEGGWIISCRDLPEAISQAEERAQALEHAAGCLQAALEGRIRHGLPVPTPSGARAGEQLIDVPLETAAKAALHEAMRVGGMGRSELARKLGLHEKEVRRMLDPGCASKLPRLALAIQALGGRVALTIDPAPAEPSAPQP
jgi:antitoxin HicB